MWTADLGVHVWEQPPGAGEQRPEQPAEECGQADQQFQADQRGPNQVVQEADQRPENGERTNQQRTHLSLQGKLRA